jgi:hypothetical protein
MAIDLRLDQWPYVLTKFDGEQSTAELDAYIKRMDSVHARRERYVGISYLKSYSRDRVHVERIARWIKETEAVTRECCMAAGMINSSTGFRFVLSAIFLIKPMACPYHVTGTFDEAASYVRRIANERGMQLPVAVNPWQDLPK